MTITRALLILAGLLGLAATARVVLAKVNGTVVRDVRNGR